MSLEGISSKGSLRFDEFPTSMKATQSFSGSRATRLLAYENARLSESRCSPLLQGEPQGLRRLRFPFFISQCQRACGRAAESHTPEPLMEANPPSGVNDSQRPEKTRANSASVRKDRAVAFSLAGDASNPARSDHLRLGIRLVKGCPSRGAREKLSSRFSRAL